MAQIDPMMGLRLWTQGQDLYDHDQLATNFSKLGLHDHTPGRGVQIPTEGIFDGAITYAKIARTSYQATTIAVPTTASGAISTVTVTWGTAFTDANYVVTALLTAPSGSLVRVFNTTKAAGSAVFEVRNDGATALTGATLNVVGVHT